MIIRSFFILGIAHNSYLIGASASCLIVDPSRDITKYLDTAKREGMRIAGILETHLHADFISGHCDLHEATGAPIYMHEMAGCKFPHIGVKAGSVIELEDLSIEVRETPGHTPEHLSFVLINKNRGEDPVAVFCGDTLFVGDVGRPDLFPGNAEELANALHTSLHEELLSLPDFCEVYPAHGAGSLCGRSIDMKQTSTIGYERRYNPALLISDRDEFVRSLITNMPEAPDHFSRCSAVNRTGPELISKLPQPVPLTPAKVKEALNKSDNYQAVLVDIRRYDAFGGCHIPGSWNLDIEVNFSTFAGWALPPDRDLILMGISEYQVQEAVLMMHRVGLDRVIGWVAGGQRAWAFSGQETGHISVISSLALKRLIKDRIDLQIVDVRTPSEYQVYHISDSLNIPWPDLRISYEDLDPTCPTVAICATGGRSGIACSILKQHGLKEVYNIAGGYTSWMATGVD